MKVNFFNVVPGGTYSKVLISNPNKVAVALLLLIQEVLAMKN